jgi:AcrR family transcriptional regulator
VSTDADGADERHEYEVLLERVVDHVLEDGLAGLSVRTIARSAGCEPGVLAHHFGTKDELVGLVLERVRLRLLAVTGAPQFAPGARLLHLWGAWTAPEHRPLVRVFFEAHGLTTHPNPGRFLPFVRHTVLDLHLALRAHGMDEITATVLAATVHGALLDRLSTGDEGRTDAAVHLVAAALGE